MIKNLAINTADDLNGEAKCLTLNPLYLQGLSRFEADTSAQASDTGRVLVTA